MPDGEIEYEFVYFADCDIELLHAPSSAARHPSQIQHMKQILLNFVQCSLSVTSRDAERLTDAHIRCIPLRQAAVVRGFLSPAYLVPQKPHSSLV